MEDYKRKYSEVSERLMERNRQYQKLQGLYDSLRLRNMVVGVGEKDTLPQPGPHQSFNVGKSSKFTLCTVAITISCGTTKRWESRKILSLHNKLIVTADPSACLAKWLTFTMKYIWRVFCLFVI